MAEFEEACYLYDVKLLVLPPRIPKQLNGHIERMQRTFRDGFYTRPLHARIAGIQTELIEYLDYCNRRRPHRALNGLALPKEGAGEEPVPQDGESQMYWLITAT